MAEQQPVIAKRGPYLVEPGTDVQFWCRCGRSASQPYCDGSHKGTGLAPLRFQLGAAEKVALCGCKRTANPPYCDGTHAKLPKE